MKQVYYGRKAINTKFTIGGEIAVAIHQQTQQSPTTSASYGLLNELQETLMEAQALFMQGMKDMMLGLRRMREAQGMATAQINATAGRVVFA